MNSFATSRILGRPGLEVIQSLRRFHGEEGSKKIVFLYERTRHLYENKEGYAENEAKTKLKTCCFVAQSAGKKTKAGAFLTKQTPKDLAQRRPKGGPRWRCYNEGENASLGDGPYGRVIRPPRRGE